MAALLRPAHLGAVRSPRSAAAADVACAGGTLLRPLVSITDPTAAHYSVRHELVDIDTRLEQ